ncbi:hypothetical protein LCGC14_2990940, partial [marine sediment metagenome]
IWLEAAEDYREKLDAARKELAELRKKIQG